VVPVVLIISSTARSVVKTHAGCTGAKIQQSMQMALSLCGLEKLLLLGERVLMAQVLLLK